MWKTFKHNEALYMIKSTKIDGINFYVTDLQAIWVQSLSPNLLLQEFQNQNPLFDIKEDEAVTQVINLLNQVSEMGDIELVKNEDELTLLLQSIKSEFPLKFSFKFNKSTADMFMKEVTVPLIQTVKHLEHSQNILCNLVKKKDRELEEYKLEKGLISREDLITEKFEDSMLGTISDDSMLNVFGKSEAFWDTFTEKYGDIKSTIEDVKIDPWNHIKRRKKVYSSKTVVRKGKGINYTKN